MAGKSWEQNRAAAQEQGRRNAARGRWGERTVEAFLVNKGWRILERNARPCEKDHRCEIDLVVRTPGGVIVFVEVKTHVRPTAWSTRLAGVDARKRRILLRACANWLMRNHWHGNYRFDVVEVWGAEDSGLLPEIDHVENVPLFGPNWRFW